MLRPLLTSTFLFASLTGAFFAFSATADELPERVAVPSPVAVSVETARTRTWRLEVPTLGELEAEEGLDVTAQCAGRVRSLHFESGQEVECGQLLVQFDDAAERARLAELRMRVAEAQAALAHEPTDSEQRADLQREFDALTDQMATVQRLADSKRVLAPFSGQLGMREVRIGQEVRPGEVLVALRRLAPIRVALRLPEIRFGRVEPGCPLEVRVGAFPQREFRGVVASIEPWIDPATRSFRVEGVLDNADGALRPGMLASVSVQLLEERSVVTVPAAAVRRTPHGCTVFVIDERPSADAADARLAVSRRYVKLGERRGDDFAVLSGLEPGARVVVTSSPELADGAAVELAAAGASTP